MTDVLDARVTTMEGEERVLRDVVEGRAALVVFLRHFGCVGCSAHVTALAPRIGELDRLGVAVVFVGNGDRAQLEGFVERHGIADRAATFVTDPSLEAYRAAGFGRSLWGVVGPRGLCGQIRALGDGHVPEAIQGDVRQQGGAVVLDRDGSVRFSHKSRAISDNAPTADLVAAAMKTALEDARPEGIV